MYIVHFTLYIEKRSKPVGLLSSAPRFWFMFFLIAEAADRISVVLVVVVPVHVRVVVVQVAVVGVVAVVLRRGPEVGVVARVVERRTVAVACRNGGK